MQTIKIKYLSFIIIIFMIFNCSIKSNPKNKPKVVNGVIDLSEWDFKRDGIVDLRGEWKFKWMSDKFIYKSSEYNDTNWETFQVPGYWNKVVKKQNGYCWLRVKIKNINNKNLGLFIKYAESAYKLYINGYELISSGKVGNNRKNSIPKIMTKIESLPDDNEIVIAWHISNYHSLFGGASNSPKIGLINDLRKKLLISDFTVVLILGIIIMMCIYHFFLWIGRKKDKASLFFSLFCFIIIIRTLTIEHYLMRIFPDLELFEINSKVAFFAIPAGWSLYITFIRWLFPEEFSKKIYFIFYGLALFLSLLTIFTPSWIFCKLLYFYEISLVLVCIWVLISIIYAVKNKRESSLIILMGFIIIFIGVINDVISANIAAYNIYMIQFSLAIFLLSQSIILSMRFAKAYNTAEYLSHNLQKEVDKKTDKIKEQNKEIIKVSEQKTNFFINLAHETKTPLTLISNYLDKYLSKQNHSYELDIIKNNIDKLKRDMVNFLDIEKLERGQLFYNHDQIVNLTKVLKTTILLFQEIANNKKIKVISNISDIDIFIKIDVYAIDRVINNILENAIRYTNEEGEINIILKKNDEYKVGLIISDTGMGISKEKLEHIFESYYQISHKKRNIEGIGVGLSIVKKIIDQVDGEIKIDSKINQGTTFKVIFKNYELSENDIVEDDIEHSETLKFISIDKLHENRYDESKYNVLIIEDNIHLLAYLHDSMKFIYNVFCAQNGEEAIKKLENIPKPNLIVSDILMDVMGGYDFYKKLLDNVKLKDIPLIFLTAKTTLDEKLEGLSKGVIDYIYKPFNISELLAKINSIIKNQEIIKDMNIAEMENKIVKVLKADENYDEINNFNENCLKYNITSREKEVIQLVLKGNENKEISDLLDISFETVRTHLKNIYKKCNVQNKVELLNILK